MVTHDPEIIHRYPRRLIVEDNQLIEEEGESHV